MRSTAGAAPRFCASCRALYRSDVARCPADGGALAVAGADPLIGTTIAGRYTLESLLGEGAMGRVYRAHHVRSASRRFAVKILVGDLAASPAMRRRFAREARTASRLDHPNLVGVVDSGRTERGLLYLAMELVEGRTLGAALREEALAPARVLHLAAQLCDGLAHAHARGIVHRDVKPDNILLVASGDSELARLADFGLATSTLDDGASPSTSAVLCTPAYAAPEQLRGRRVDPRADLYALGVTLFEMLTGALPFGADARTAAARKLAGPAPSAGDLGAFVPARFAAVIARLLAPDPADRFASAAELKRALADCRGHSLRAATLVAAAVAVLAAAVAWCA
ncbi:MAG: serine/threonine protein kinase, partial [Deltaproteobacteria bacterium]|nr:serine/threonine protein kinase [Deltaproteobacteria bacterium]